MSQSTEITIRWGVCSQSFSMIAGSRRLGVLLNCPFIDKPFVEGSEDDTNYLIFTNKAALDILEHRPSAFIQEMGATLYGFICSQLELDLVRIKEAVADMDINDEYQRHVASTNWFYGRHFPNIKGKDECCTYADLVAGNCEVRYGEETQFPISIVIRRLG